MGDILVIGGRGNTGRHVAQGLLKAGTPHRIGTRYPDGDREVGFDWNRPDVARAAFSGASAVYVVAPTDTTRHGEIVIPLLEDALSVGVERFVLLSASSLERGGPMMGTIHDWLPGHAPGWVVLRPSWFMQNFSAQHRPSIRDEGAIYTGSGQGRVGFIDAADIGRAAVSALTSAKSWNQDFILTGPRALNYDQVADLFSQTLERPIRHVALAHEDYIDRLMSQGLDRTYAEALAAMDAAISGGSEDRVTSHVLTLTGQSPVDLQEHIERHHAAWEKPSSTR